MDLGERLLVGAHRRLAHRRLLLSGLQQQDPQGSWEASGRDTLPGREPGRVSGDHRYEIFYFFGRNHVVVTVLCARRALEPRHGGPQPAQDDVSPAPEADGDAPGGAGPEDPGQ